MEAQTHVINYSHPMTEAQITDIQVMLNEHVDVVDIPCQIDFNQGFLDQCVALVDSVGFSSREWQTRSFVVRTPALDNAALTVMAEIHGRCGYWPRLVRIVKQGAYFVVVDILDLQEVSNVARTRR